MQLRWPDRNEPVQYTAQAVAVDDAPVGELQADCDGVGAEPMLPARSREQLVGGDELDRSQAAKSETGVGPAGVAVARLAKDEPGGSRRSAVAPARRVSSPRSPRRIP
jgi:hypothetical protein